MLFVGTYPVSIDAKSRLSVPYVVRDRMMRDEDGRAFYVVPGRRRGTLMLFPDKYYERRMASAVPSDAISDATYEYSQFEHSQTALVEPDTQGRILIPERLLKRVGIGKEATLIGVHDHLELWDRKGYELFEEHGWQKHPEGRSGAVKELREQSPPAAASGMAAPAAT